jgi:RND family efflux transporter MFP subunit
MRDLAQANLLQARANADSYTAKVSTARRQAELARANMRFDQAQRVLAYREFWRYRTLWLQGFATTEQSDQMEAGYKSAVAKVDADRQAVLAAESGVSDAMSTELAAIAAMHSASFALTASQDNISVAVAALTSGQRVIDENRQGLAANVANEKHFADLSGFQQVLAPFDGVITARNIEIGSLVNAPTAVVADNDPGNTAPRGGLFGLACLDPLEIDIRIPQTYYAAMAVGQTADVAIREHPEETYPGVITAVSGALDGPSRTLQIKVRLANPKQVLRPGMYAEISFRSLDLAPTLHVPSTALLVDSKGTRVAVVTSDNKINLRQVKMGRDLGSESEILTGLKDDEEFVVTPADTLKEDMVVQIHTPTPTPSPTTSGH